LYLDGEINGDKHKVELTLSCEIELTLRLGKALLIDSKAESKRIIRNLEETLIYKLPNLEKCMLSGIHKQGLDVNDGKIIVRNMSTDQDEWVEPKQFVRSRIMDIPLQSLFFSLLNYRYTLEKYFYYPSSPTQTSNFFHIEMMNFEFVHLNNIKNDYDQPDPEKNQS